MHLLALDDEQCEILRQTIHYLLRKEELRRNQKIRVNEKRIDTLRSVLEQVLQPKRVWFGLDKQGYQYEIKSMTIDTNQIFLRPY